MFLNVTKEQSAMTDKLSKFVCQGYLFILYVHDNRSIDPGDFQVIFCPLKVGIFHQYNSY